MRQGGLLVVLDVGLGQLAAYAATSLVAGMLYGVSGHDPFTFAAISLLLGLVALLAIYIPALRAARVEPTGALR
jgi:ABC-type antimicrobial peptide transport system permease subunit